MSMTADSEPVVDREAIVEAELVAGHVSPGGQLGRRRLPEVFRAPLRSVAAVARFLGNVLEWVFGAVALNIHGIGRATEDLDFFIKPDSKNVERLRRALKRVYNDPSIDEISSEDLCGDYPAVRYVPPKGDFYLDILTRLGEFARFEDLEVETVIIEGIEIPVVTPRQLYRLKRDTVRDQDQMDAARLREKFALEDEE